jgi:7-carboxy-7-deazaguanine synthase
MVEGLLINEIFLSLQGESTLAGLPCILVRLTGCDLRCSYCDTAYAFSVGERIGLPEILDRVNKLAAPYGHDVEGHRLPLVEITGGEPLLQSNVFTLMRQLCDDGFTVMLETNGAHDVSLVDPRVRRIIDLKCPSSGEAHRNHWPNIACLRPTDEVKLVIRSSEDYEWARVILVQHHLNKRCPVLFSWASPLESLAGAKLLKPMPENHQPISRRELAERIIADAVPARFQAQLHKVIWPQEMRGV